MGLSDSLLSCTAQEQCVRLFGFCVAWFKKSQRAYRPVTAFVLFPGAWKQRAFPQLSMMNTLLPFVALESFKMLQESISTSTSASLLVTRASLLYSNKM